jgi:hypothetical protein
VQKSALLAALKQEIQRHDFTQFIDAPLSVAEASCEHHCGIAICSVLAKSSRE